MDPCKLCRSRKETTTIREPYDLKDFDQDMGLERRSDNSDNVLQCPVCGTLYSKYTVESSMFHDYDEYVFTKQKS